MENVYVIKVKTKPALSSLYPSERRYSASTVGGLSFVHFGLGALSLLLGSLALSLQGPILSVACLVPFVTGLLAWRRWYIDRNIAIFFYGSLFSLIAAILCFIATVFDIAAATESRGPLWSFQEILERPADPTHLEVLFKNDTLSNETVWLNEDTFDLAAIYDRASNVPAHSPTPGIIFDSMSNISGYILRASTDGPEEDDRDSRANASLPRDPDNVTSATSLWRSEYNVPSHTKILLTVNVLVASLLEAFWSALSARIALRGMTNRLPESSYANGPSGKLEATTGKRKSPPPRPDILDHDSRLSENLQNLTTLHGLRNSGPRLPLPESSREFRERVERFLANQAAHRAAEGSCS